MVVLNKIYTRTGDAGTTALGTGERVPKHSARIAAYGTVDETNAAIGVARLHVRDEHADVDAMLGRIQNDLFDLGADLTMPERGAKHAARERLRVSEAQVKRLEDEIDAMNGELSPLRSFVLPGGSAAAAALHVARTVCRRAERAMVELAGRARRGRRRSGAQVHQSLVRSSVCGQPLCQRARRGRCPVGAGAEPLAGLRRFASSSAKVASRGLHPSVRRQSPALHPLPVGDCRPHRRQRAGLRLAKRRAGPNRRPPALRSSLRS